MIKNISMEINKTMKQKNSTILEILNGNRGKFENIPKSEEYHDALSKLVEKIEEFENQLKDYPKLLEAHNEVMEASDLECAIFADDVYLEAFSIGLAIGQEVFGKKN